MVEAKIRVDQRDSLEILFVLGLTKAVVDTGRREQLSETKGVHGKQ